jgi:phosphomannomutase / phosphoglucomutase
MSESTHSISRNIFRAYDIRGVVGETLNADIIHLIGQAIGSEALEQGEAKIVVARDGRLSGPTFSKALIEGLLSTGINVVDIGRVPTPVLYYATNVLDTTSGVMLTGSHNPVNHNGTKIVIKGKSFSGEQIQSLYLRIQAENFAKGMGVLSREDLLPLYLERVIDDVKVTKPLKVVVDCGNGVAGVIAPMLLKKLGCEVHELFCEVDGNFPNHHPDPSQEENLQDLIQMVCQKEADIGLAFDGDGDRLGVVTAKGDIIWPDRQLVLYAMHVLKEHPGATIIYDVKSTRYLDTAIKEHGGKPLMYKTGHSFVKAKIKEVDAKLGGEMSGHMFFNDRWYGFDDAVYTAARLLEIIANDGRTSDEIFAKIPESLSTPELKIAMSDEEKFSFVEELQAYAGFGEDATVNTIDGVRVDYAQGWGLVRASNTTPYLVVRFEADNEKTLSNIQCKFRKVLLSLHADLKLPF